MLIKQYCKFLFSGKEDFPIVWPSKVLQLFDAKMSSDVLVSVDHFDGTFNQLNVTAFSAQGCGNINLIILKSLIHDTQAEGHKQTQAGGTSSAHKLSKDTGQPNSRTDKKGMW